MNASTDTSLVEFYTQHKISPVRQDITDLRAHCNRRAALYRHLGILPMAVTGRTVLEIGPGSGYNSLYTVSLRPSRYVLVEPNPTGVTDIERLFAAYPEWQRAIEVQPMLLEAYARQAGGERFDIVLCEGILSGVPNPEAMLQQAAAFVAPGGVLVITCIDHISYFPDTLRRLCAQRLVCPDQSLQGQTAVLLPIFTHHLARLKGMNRPHEDWIVDNLINPASIGRLCSIPEAIAVVADEFAFYASSPHFIADWRWYKGIGEELSAINRMAVDQYWQQVHNFLDARQLFPPRAAQANRELEARCRGVRDALRQFETTREQHLLQAIRGPLREIAQHVKGFSLEVAGAIREVESWLSQEPTDGTALAQAQRFGGWFARGQQYVSFTRSGS